MGGDKIIPDLEDKETLQKRIPNRISKIRRNFSKTKQDSLITNRRLIEFTQKKMKKCSKKNQQYTINIQRMVTALKLRRKRARRVAKKKRATELREEYLNYIQLNNNYTRTCTKNKTL